MSDQSHLILKAIFTDAIADHRIRLSVEAIGPQEVPRYTNKLPVLNDIATLAPSLHDSLPAVTPRTFDLKQVKPTEFYAIATVSEPRLTLEIAVDALKTKLISALKEGLKTAQEAGTLSSQQVYVTYRSNAADLTLPVYLHRYSKDRNRIFGKFSIMVTEWGWEYNPLHDPLLQLES